MEQRQRAWVSYGSSLGRRHHARDMGRSRTAGLVQLPVTEKVGMALKDRAAKSETTLVLREPGYEARGSIGVGGGEEVAGKESVALIEPIGRAMEIVGSVLGDNLYLRAGVAPEFGIEVVLDQL